jgi:hypothetical protein
MNGPENSSMEKRPITDRNPTGFRADKKICSREKAQKAQKRNIL